LEFLDYFYDSISNFLLNKNHLKNLSKITIRKKDQQSEKFITNTSNLKKRHGGILGLCSIVNSSPYDIPNYLPETITYLCQFVNDPVPIQVISFFYKKNTELIILYSIN
jgi:hypothetical protein